MMGGRRRDKDAGSGTWLENTVRDRWGGGKSEKTESTISLRRTVYPSACEALNTARNGSAIAGIATRSRDVGRRDRQWLTRRVSLFSTLLLLHFYIITIRET